MKNPAKGKTIPAVHELSQDTLERVKSVAHSLATTDESINILWPRAGFKTYPEFSSAFIAVHGMTPTKYRTQFKQATKQDPISIAQKFLDESQTYPKLDGIIAEIESKTNPKITLSKAVLLQQFVGATGMTPGDYFKDKHLVPALEEMK
jgi:hypothetical protein